MKKIIITLLVGILVSNFSYATAVNDIKQIFKADLESQRVPAGKIVKVKFLDDLNTVRSLPGDQFSASLAEDILVEDKMILPAGTIMRGVIENIDKSSRPKAPAVIYLSFDHVVTPLGRQVPVTLRLANIPNVTQKGGLSAGGSYYECLDENFDDSVEFVKKSVSFGVETGEKFWGGYPKYVITPVTATGGFCASSLMFFGKSIVNLFMKGNEVIINQGQIISGMLIEPLDIPTN